MNQPNDTPKRDKGAPAFGPGRGGPMGGGPMRAAMGGGEKLKEFSEGDENLFKISQPVPFSAHTGIYFCDCQHRFYDIGPEAAR